VAKRGRVFGAGGGRGEEKESLQGLTDMMPGGVSEQLGVLRLGRAGVERVVVMRVEGTYCRGDA